MVKASEAIQSRTLPRELRASAQASPSADASHKDSEADIFCQNSDIPIRVLKTSDKQLEYEAKWV